MFRQLSKARYRKGLPENTSDVCILSLHFPPEPTGNAPYVGGLASGLATSGHQVTAHVGYPHYPEWKIYQGYRGLSTREHRGSVDVQRRRHYVPQPPRGARRLLSEISFGLRLVFARWGEPDVVVAVSPSLFSTAVAVTRLRLTPSRPPLILWVQDIYSLGVAETGEGGAFVQRVTRWVEKYTAGSADRIVVSLKNHADFITDELGISASKVKVVRNWTHLAPSPAIEPSAAKAALGWPTDATLAVHTGNIGVKQGLENIVDAARLADETNAPVRFILVGDGGERRTVEAYGRGVSRLQFVDPLDDREYRLALAAADVLVVNEKPGVSSMALPSKLTAYFDAGRPIVAAADPAGITAAEVSAAGAGLVVPGGEPARLLDAVLQLRADPDAANRYGASGRLYREKYLGEEHAIGEWDRLIADVAPRTALPNRPALES